MHPLPLRLTAALAGSIAAVLGIRAVTDAAHHIPSAFTPLAIGSVVSLTAVGVLLAATLRVVLGRRVEHPDDTYRVIVVGALPLTMIPDAAIWIAGAYHGTATADTVLPLLAMHVVVAVICVVAFARPRRRGARVAARA